MGMYAEASRTNYTPEYSFQKPENGYGASFDTKNAAKTDDEVRQEEAVLKQLIKDVDRLIAA